MSLPGTYFSHQTEFSFLQTDLLPILSRTSINHFEKQFFKKTLVLQRKTTSKQASYQPKGFFSICAFNLLFQAVPRSHDDDVDGEEDIKTSQSTK